MSISISHTGATNNAATVYIGNLALHFSYTTLVGYDDHHDGLVVRQNDWGPTTGKHLNALDNGNKESRLPKAEFDTKVAAMLKRHGLDKY